MTEQTQDPKAINKIFEPAHDINEAQRIPRSGHSISRKSISHNALKVMNRLSGAGYDAFLVGGAVRDMLLGKQPKDFDIATNATPEEVNKLFKNARIIGRRFRIVHVRFGREIIEVTTFRGHHDNIDNSDKQKKNHTSSIDDSGMLLRDNVFGSIEDDAIRRDFTANALYYSSRDFSVYDFVDGLRDIQHHVLRIIGDPDTRFKEDPVRILRAARLAAKLDFDIDPETEKAIAPNAELLRNIPPARLFDESIKIFSTGHGKASLEQLVKYDLLKYLVSSSESLTGQDTNLKFISQALANTDTRIAKGKSVTPAFLYAAFLWPRMNVLKQSLLAEGHSTYSAMQSAIQMCLNEQYKLTSIPKRFQVMIREIWTMQYRLHKRQGRNAYKLLEQPRFRAAYDFLLLREQAGEIEPGLGEWWTLFQQQNDHERQEAINQLDHKEPRKKPRKRKPYSKTQH